SVSPLSVEQAAGAFESGKTDGFISIPQAALAFQWSAMTHYFSEVRLAFLPGCLVIANRVFDSLNTQDQQSIREAVAKLRVRFQDLGRTQDALLLGTLFAKQGTHPMPPNATFRAELQEAAVEARKAIPPDLVSPDLIAKVQGWLADFRGEAAAARH